MKDIIRSVSLAVVALIAVTSGCGDGASDGADGAIILGGDTLGLDTVSSADSAAGDAGACGEPRTPLATTSGAIVNGVDSWNPAVVSLDAARAMAVGGIIVAFDFGDEIVCTATLIAPQVVLTAAHCVMRSANDTFDASRMSFAVGADLATPRASFAVSTVQRHPSYDYWGDDASHDVAILVLAESATAALGQEITPLPVNCGPISAAGFVGADLQTVGYGAVDKWGEDFRTQRKWAIEEIVGLSSLDFTVDGNGVAGVCYGDSGGPGLFELTAGVPSVVGVLSWGDEMCTREDHFVRTDHECDFITPFLPSCGAVTEAGACEEDTAVYCASDAVVREDCAARGAVCGADADGHSRCVEPQPDPCQGETFAGRCDGATAVWCEAGTVNTRACAPCELACGWVDALGGYDCVAAP